MLIDAINGIIKTVTKGSRAYKIWVGVLLALAAIGISFVVKQAGEGLIVTNMRNQV